VKAEAGPGSGKIIAYKPNDRPKWQKSGEEKAMANGSDR